MLNDDTEIKEVSDLLYWKLSDETKFVLKEITEEIQRQETEINSGSLMLSPTLDREYCYAVGYIAGLKYLKEKLSSGEIEQI